jgi:polysaccharide pyruvyl transferase WcaK-like protein
MRRKILLIGDLTPAHNVGAIATTTELIDQLNSFFPEAEFKYIDHRSFIKPTPIEGWNPWVAPRPSLRKRTHSRFVSLIKRVLRSYFNKASPPKKPFTELIQSHIPNLWKEFHHFSQLYADQKVLLYEKRLIDWADFIIVNGEGNIVNGTDNWGRYRIGARYILTLAYLAKKVANKKVAIINFTCDPGSNQDGQEMTKNILPLLDLVLPREPLSVNTIQSWGINQFNEWTPDILFAYDRKKIKPVQQNKKLQSLGIPSKDFICLGDSSGMRSIASTVKWDIEIVYGEIIKRIRNELNKEVVILDGFGGSHGNINNVIRNHHTPYLNINNCSYGDIIDMLSCANLFISGRWHASIMASLSGTPFLLWGSDSHKTKSLYTIFDYKYSFFDINTLPVHIDELIEESKSIIQNERSLRNHIAAKSRILGDKSLEMITSIKSFL